MMRTTLHETSIHLDRLCLQTALVLALDMWAFNVRVMNPIVFN